MEYWREYYILGAIGRYRFQIINNWHYFKHDKWHLIGLFREWYNGYFSYFFCLIGFQLRIYRKGVLKTNK